VYPLDTMTDLFYLFANCNFVPDKYKDWQAAYDQLAKHVYPNEPTTMSYYFGIPVEYADNFSATTMMLAFEVYGKREDLYETHFKSLAMGEFLKKIPSTMTTGLDLMHYSCIGGYIDQPGDMKNCVIMRDTRISCISTKARVVVLSKLAQLAQQIENAEAKEGRGVYTWMAFSSLDNDTSVRIFARFGSREAMERHVRRKDVAKFWSESKEDIKQMEWRCYLPNGKGWLHR